MSKLIFHVDLNQFFAAVEIRDNPALRGKPLIVGGNAIDRGIVTTATYEARRYGISSGMALSEAGKLCPHGVFITPPSINMPMPRAASAKS